MTAQLHCTHARTVRVSRTGYSLVEDEDGPAHLFVKSSDRGTRARTGERPAPTRGEAA